ncbi:endoglucanase [Marinilabilia salmonicolor]|uniref:Endoglucanase n=2 Tax=Marinilabilia salmonicolor TaxID=989 RepID=A0A2T0XBU1_9BACT|nr:endoglucanase [Marinilabilia salmonicolor]RCW37539.1 endoglucanase [Marinilabilia salmonicolor]
MNFMLKRFSLTFLIILGITANACSDRQEPTIEPEVKLSQKEFSFSAEGETKTLTVETNIPLEMEESAEEWCTTTGDLSEIKGTLQFDISTTANSSADNRWTNITLLGTDYVRDIKIIQAGAEQSSEDEEETDIVEAEASPIIKKLGLGWNLGNQLDAHSNGVSNETIWGNDKTTQEAFDKIAEAGIHSVRIPVTWLGHIGEAPDYTIEENWLNRVAEVVGYAENAGLNAIVNIHHDGADSHYWLDIKGAATDETVNTQVKNQLSAMWTQIAEKFKDKGDFLIFESMNEIHDGDWGWGDNRTDGGAQYATLNQWNQVFVDAVRATGGNNSDRYLGVPGYCTNPELTIEHFELPDDVVEDRLLIAVHYYDPYEYTLNDKYSEWGHTAEPSKKESYGDEAHLREVFNSLKTKFTDNGIPVYLGEVGNVHRSTERAESFRKYYLEYMCKAAKTYGMAPFFWDNGATGAGKECSGIINHSTGEYINNGKEIVDVMVKAITTEDEDYTLRTVYDNAPQ